MNDKSRVGCKKDFLVFDLGGVLVRLHSIAALWPDTGLKEKEKKKLEIKWPALPAVRAYESGRIETFDSFYHQIKEPLAWRWGKEAFHRFYQQIIGEPFDQTHALLERLQKKQPVYLLSNTSPVHWQYVKKEFGLHRYFRETYLSYEIGSMKPSAGIYQKVISALDAEPGKIWFFDDKPENVLAAKSLSMNAFQVTGHEDLLAHPILFPTGKGEQGKPRIEGEKR